MFLEVLHKAFLSFVASFSLVYFINKLLIKYSKLFLWISSIIIAIILFICNNPQCIVTSALFMYFGWFLTLLYYILKSFIMKDGKLRKSFNTEEILDDLKNSINWETIHITAFIVGMIMFTGCRNGFIVFVYN